MLLGSTYVPAAITCQLPTAMSSDIRCMTCAMCRVDKVWARRYASVVQIYKFSTHHKLRMAKGFDGQPSESTSLESTFKVPKMKVNN